METNLKNKITFLHILIVTFVLLVILILMVASSVRTKAIMTETNEPVGGEVIHGDLDAFEDTLPETSASGLPR